MTNGKAMTNEQQRQLLRILAAKKDTVRTVCDPDGCLARYSVKSTPIGEVFFDDGDNHLWTYKYRPNNRFPYAVKLDERQLARFNDWLLDECRAELLELLNKLPENNKGEDKKKKTIPEMIKELKKADYMGIDEVVVDYLDVEDEQGNTHYLCFDYDGKLMKDISSDVDEAWVYGKVREYYYSKFGSGEKRDD